MRTELTRCLAKGKGILKDSKGKTEMWAGVGAKDKSSTLSTKATENRKESELSFHQRQ